MAKNNISDDASPDLKDELITILDDPITVQEHEAIDELVKKTRIKTFGKNAGKVERPERNGRITIRVNNKIDQAVRYWADKNEITVSEFVIDAIQEKIARANGDYDVPTLEQARMSQMIDAFTTLADAVDNLEKSFNSGMETIVVMSRHPSYLSDKIGGIDD